MKSQTLKKWGEAKRLSFALEQAGSLGSPGLNKIGEGMWAFAGGEWPEELSGFHELLYKLKVVDPSHSTPLSQEPDFNFAAHDAEGLNQLITWICRSDRFVEGTIQEHVNNRILTRAFRRLYLLTICDREGWPHHCPAIDEKTMTEGLVVKSLSGKIEGRTTGSRRHCPAKGCPGWLIGVLWETGQQLFICSEGWHYDSDSRQISVIGGGEISARFVSPKPLGTPPLPKSGWPRRGELAHRKGWRINP